MSKTSRQMKNAEMITSGLNIQIAKGIESAPIYREDYKLVKAVSAFIVPRGTVNGNPTVDIQLSDADGNKYVLMATGGIIEALGQVVSAKRVETNTN